MQSSTPKLLKTKLAVSPSTLARTKQFAIIELSHFSTHQVMKPFQPFANTVQHSLTSSLLSLQLTMG